MKKLVSVIIAIYNGEETLKTTVDSVLAQTYKNIEIILIDDGSTDNSAKIIKKIKDPRITLLKKSNSGSPAAPRNLGIKNSKGDFIAFCDQDDIWYSQKLEKQLEAFEKLENREDVGIIICSADLVNKSGKKINLNVVNFSGYLSPNDAFPKILSGNFISACSVLVPKKVIDDIGGLKEELIGVDDYDLWIRITKKYGILSIKETLCAWRQDKRSLSADKAKQYIENEKIFTKLGDKTKDIRFGHGKNLVRIILALLLQKDFSSAKKYLIKIKGYPLSFKTKIIIKISNFSLVAGYMLVRLLKVMKKVSL